MLRKLFKAVVATTCGNRCALDDLTARYNSCCSVKVFNIEILGKFRINLIRSYEFQFKPALLIKTGCLEFICAAIYIIKIVLFIILLNFIYQLSSYAFASVCFFYDQFVNVDFGKKVAPVITPTSTLPVFAIKQNGV